ncbi:unnamed protein product [Diamesa serratosioi]
MWKFQCKLNTLILSLILLHISQYVSASTVEISSYAKVSKNGDSVQLSSTVVTPVTAIETSTISSRSTLIDKLNVTTATVTANEKETKTQSVNDNKSLNGISTGRAIQNDYYFPLRNFLTRPIRQKSLNNNANINYNNNVNEKSPRYIVYPSYTPNNINNNEQDYRRIQGQPTAQDRFSPGEAYAGTIYKIKHPEKATGYQYKPPKAPTKNQISSYIPPPAGNKDEAPDAPISSVEPKYKAPKDLLNFPPNVDSKYYPPGMIVANQISSYIPPPSGNKDEAPDASVSSVEPKYKAPKELYNFPPNVNSQYYPPGMVVAKNQINSYIPPPSGNKDEAPDAPISSVEPKYKAPKDLFNFPPNIDSQYLPPEMRNPANQISSYLPPPSGNRYVQSGYDTKYLPPKNLFSFPPNVDATYLPPEMRNPLNPVTSYLPPPSGSVEDNQSSMLNFVGQQPYQYGPPPSGPPASMMAEEDHDHHHHHDHYGPPPPDMPPADEHDHHHHHHHEEPPSGPPADEHDHHHHHHHDEPPADAGPPSMPPSGPPSMPPTPEPEEPRVKKYSYYYLGRKLWYIPLYFTLWFCLYVAALIFRSIGRHKVDLPNHYTARGARSLHDLSHKETVEKIDKITQFTMAQIEDFKEKYL